MINFTVEIWDSKENEIPSTYTLTTDHAASSYGMPILVGPDGTAYGPLDYLPNGELAANELVMVDLNGQDQVDAVNKFRKV